MPAEHTLLIEPETLASQLDTLNQVIVDLSDAAVYAQGHIPGAVHLNYADIIQQQPPVMGLLPTEANFSETLRSLGISPNTKVIAYDNEGCGKASRFLWTLHAAGHYNCSLLNGGTHAWQAASLPMSSQAVTPGVGEYEVTFFDDVVADRKEIMQCLDDPMTVIMDARSANEYLGIDVRATRGGHIPGAINLDWLELMDDSRNLRLKSADALRAKLAELEFSPEQQIIVHCQTHHRSALSYIMLKSLGYPRVKGYPGSWSDWGNQPDTPIVTGTD